MNAFIVICILVSLPMSIGLNCYQCSGLSDGCKDPFNKLGSGVSATGTNNTNTYCKKEALVGVVTRSGETSCSPTKFVLNTGVACCQTDLCNGACPNKQMAIILIVGLVILLAKIQWA